MSFLAASAFLKALGWALVNSTWLFAICWLLYYVITTAVKNISATAKHTIAIGLLFTGTLSFITVLCREYFASSSASLSTSSTENILYYAGLHTANNFLDTIMPYWSLLYLICVGFLFIKLCFFVRQTGHLQKNGLAKMNAARRMYIKNISAQLGIQKKVQAFLSEYIDTPQVIGFLKPVILIPAACLANLTTEQLEAVLLHELVHIKRNDYLVNLFVASAEILFFFNPFVKQITSQIRKEREYSCDDMVMQFQFHPGNYASALLTLEKYRLMPVTYGIAASGKNQRQLLTRIERILGIKNKQTSFYQLGVCLVALLLLFFVITMRPEKIPAGDQPAAGLFAFADNSVIGMPLYNTDAGAGIVISNDASLLIKTFIKDNKTKKTGNTAEAPAKTNEPVVEQDGLFSAVSSSDDAGEAITVMNAAAKEARDFALPQKTAPDVPEAPDGTTAEAEPYVPASSFSYQFIQDTAMPKTRELTSNERRANEAMVKTQKALASINWKKIEKDLKYNNRELAKLKTALIVQLQKVNWQKINNDVQNEVSQEQMQKLQEAINQEQAIRQNQAKEAYYETINRQLAEQAQYIKISDQRAKESLKAAEQQQIKLQLEMKKRRIISI